jgi:hypothetical protein
MSVSQILFNEIKKYNKSIKIFVGMPEGKKQPTKFKRRFVKVCITDMECETGNWIRLVQIKIKMMNTEHKSWF